MLDKMQLFGKPNESQNASRPGAGSVARRPPEAPPAPPSAPMPAARSDAPKAAADPAEGSKLTVGPGVKLKGADIADCGTLVVEGRVEAVLDSKAIQIAEQGSFSGRVVIDSAEIHGHFDGDLLARTRLVVHATGRVSGKIRYGKIVIEEGGEVSGDVCSLQAERTAASMPAAINEDMKRPELVGFDGAPVRPRPAALAK